MPTTFQKADAGVTDLLAAVMSASHPRLAEAGVAVGCIMALNPDGDAVKSGGYPALAKIKPVALKDRLTKGYDAELLIDEAKWNGLRDEHRAALLDHELSHVDTVDVPPDDLTALRVEDPQAPAWRLDDLGRPKLRSVPGDWCSSDGFKGCVARHGPWAVEYLTLNECKARADAARRAGEEAA